MNRPHILVIDDQIAARPDLRQEYCHRLGMVEARGHGPPEGADVAGSVPTLGEVHFCSGQQDEGGQRVNSLQIVEDAVASGWPAAAGWRWSLVLIDVRFDSRPASLSDEDWGFFLLDSLVTRWPDSRARTGNTEIPVVVLSSLARRQTAGEVGRRGAREYVEKQALDRARLSALLGEHGLVEDGDGEDLGATDRMIGRSLPLLQMLRDARQVARIENGNALVLGPTGSGKSMLGGYIHRHSARVGPYLSYFPTASAEELEYAGLFGCWKGAHSTAAESYPGKAEQAHKGTLLVDEVHSLGTRSQLELLEFGRPVAGDRWITRLGKSMPSSPAAAVSQAKQSVVGRLDSTTARIAVDVLLLSASNEPLDAPEWRRKAGFSDALYTRLAEEYAGGPLRIPSLAERAEDIPILFRAALERETTAIGGRPKASVDAAALAELCGYGWPGNVAELMGVARHAARVAKDFEEVSLRHLPDLAGKAARHARPAAARISDPERTAGPNPLQEPVPASHQRAVVDPRPGPPERPSLSALPDWLRSIEVDPNDPALDGIKPRLEAAVRELLQRCAGAALERWTKPGGKPDRIAAVRLLTGNRTLDKAEIPREIKRILGLPSTPTRVADEEIQALLVAWRRGATAPRPDGSPAAHGGAFQPERKQNDDSSS